MCRNIKPLFNFEPHVSEDEVRAAALQFVRKISGYTKPTHENEAAFYAAVEEIAHVSAHLLGAMHTHAPAKSREVEAEKARLRNLKRFGPATQEA